MHEAHGVAFVRRESSRKIWLNCLHIKYLKTWQQDPELQPGGNNQGGKGFPQKEQHQQENRS